MTISLNRITGTDMLGDVFIEIDKNWASLEEYINSISPEVDLTVETYASLEALKSKYPQGSAVVGITADDGNWNYWNGEAWVSGGPFQSQGIADGSITPEKTSFFEELVNSRIITPKPTITYVGPWTVDKIGRIVENTAYKGFVITLDGETSLSISQGGLNGFYSEFPKLLSVAIDNTRHSLGKTITGFPGGTKYVFTNVLSNVSDPIITSYSTKSITEDVNILMQSDLINFKNDVAKKGLIDIYPNFDNVGYLQKNKVIETSLPQYSYALIPVEANQKYTVSTSVVFAAWAKYAFLDANKTVTYAVPADNVDVTVTIPSGVSYLGVNKDGFNSLKKEGYIARTAISENELKGQKYVTAGDSITHASGTSLGYGSLVSDYYNLNYLNLGMNGRTMADVKVDGVTRNGFAVDRFNLVPADTDILTIMFGYNDSAYGWKSKRDDYTMATYSKLYINLTAEEKATVDAYKTQAQWTTDFIGTIDSTDKTTWCGAWNFTLDYFAIQKKIERIGVILPYGIGENMIAPLKTICEKYGVPYIDSANPNEIPTIGYSNPPFAMATHYRDRYTLDGLHPNESGYERIARGIIPWIARI